VIDSAWAWAQRGLPVDLYTNVLRSLTSLSEISWNVGQWSQWSQWSTKILYHSFIFPMGSTQFSISQPEDPTGGAGSGRSRRSGRSGRSAGIWPTSIGPIGLESGLKWSEILRPETLPVLFDEVWYTSTKIYKDTTKWIAASCSNITVHGHGAMIKSHWCTRYTLFGSVVSCGCLSENARFTFKYTYILYIYNYLIIISPKKKNTAILPRSCQLWILASAKRRRRLWGNLSASCHFAGSFHHFRRLGASAGHGEARVDMKGIE
jgi:hypothetical protein